MASSCSSIAASRVCVAQRAATLSSRRASAVAPTAAPVKLRRVRSATVEGAFAPPRSLQLTREVLFRFFPFFFLKKTFQKLAATKRTAVLFESFFFFFFHPTEEALRPSSVGNGEEALKLVVSRCVVRDGE